MEGAPEKAWSWRTITFGQVIVLILVVAVAINVATQYLDDDPSGRSRSDHRSVEKWVAEMYQDELRQKQRRRKLSGTIGVTSLECPPGKRRKARFPCLAHVAAIGEVRELAPPHVVVDIFFHHPRYFEWDARERER